MTAFKFVKFQPNDYVLLYKKGKIVKEGLGLSFMYFAPNSSIVIVPVSSIDVPFIFEELTTDYQTITIQGQLTYRIVEPKKIALLLNYTLDSNGKNYVSDDPQKLSQRIINIAKVFTKKRFEGMPLTQALKTSEVLADKLNTEIKSNEEINSLGLEILGFSILAIKPNAETSRALETQTREQILRKADEAIYERRNFAIEEERKMKENELKTEIAIENKKREIKEIQLETEKSVQQKNNELKEAQLEFATNLEEKRKIIVALKVENSKVETDAKAYELTEIFKSFSNISPASLQVLASTGMQPNKLIALAFQELAEKAEKIGTLNITPDLLQELLKTQK